MADTMSSVSGEMVLESGVLDSIAALAAAEVDGVHSLGRTGIGGALDSVAPGKQGVSSEHGQKEAAFDFDLVVEWGHNIPAVVTNVRKAVADAILQMTGLTTVEINIHVRGIHREKEESPPPRELQ